MIRESGGQAGWTCRRILVAATLWVAAIWPRWTAHAGDGFDAAEFDRKIAPLLAAHCLDCHRNPDAKGNLVLDRRDGPLVGGDSGPAIVPGDPDASLLWQRLSADEMPPQKPLTAEEKDFVRQWIESGAGWGSEPIDPWSHSSQRHAGYDWWSLVPIADVAPPQLDHATWGAHPIDAFVFSKLANAGLQPSPPADRRTLIRRLSFDLLGLPPAPERVEDFVADTRPDAYELLVEEFLASPHFGERWARHWLDVARYGESQGFERDRLRPHAWLYRDWVIQALNDDLPFDEFARQQIAGDVIRPDDPRAVIATGFLVAGPWDEVGQMQQSLAMRAVVRQDELEDVISTTCQAFVGLTVQCARCHDHKFDPIRQTDYYRVSAAFSALRHGDRELPIANPADDNARYADQLGALEHKLAQLEQPARQAILSAELSGGQVSLPRPLAEWDFGTPDGGSEAAATLELLSDAKLDRGKLVLTGGHATSAPNAAALGEKTLAAFVRLGTLDQAGGGVISVQTLDGSRFDSIVYGERKSGVWQAGSENHVRTMDLRVEPEQEAADRFILLVAVYETNGKISIYRDGEPLGEPYFAGSLAKFEPGNWHVTIGLRHSPADDKRLLRGTLDWAAVYSSALDANDVRALARQVGVRGPTDDEILAHLDAAARQARGHLVFQISQLRSRLRLGEGGKAYVANPQEPSPTHLLIRGNPQQPAEPVTAGAVPAVAQGRLSADFSLPAEAADADCRTKLAAWMTSGENPLFSRVIVNRLWHYHFGVGIVDTPNDFGFNGSRPTHPELLDWLAGQLIDSGYSLKALHRLIVTSQTYRQASTANANGQSIDAGNRLLWRKSPLRLDAEELRDAMLFVSGRLNLTMGGPGFRDFRTFHFNSQFYEPIDPNDYGSQRRTIYRMLIRSGTNRLLDVFDCPDPSTTAPRRAVTITPLQALALMNHTVVLRCARDFAARVDQSPGLDDSSRATAAYRLALGRLPTEDELAEAAGFIQQHGLPAFCRVLYNTNEFLQID